MHIIFDDTTLEPRVVNEGNERYVRILTTKRHIGNASHPASPSTETFPSSAYPVSVRPTLDTKKKDKATFCLRLARALDRYHENPGIYDPSQLQALPPILLLPAELRQTILNHVLDNEEVLFPRPTSTTQSLALVCKTFALDVRETSKLWAGRERSLRATLGMEREDLEAYVQDLMRGVRRVKKALDGQRKLSGPKTRSGKKRRRR